MTSSAHISARILIQDKAKAAARRFRNILANSGEIMESGEIRDLDQLYVMSHDGKLVKISDLNKDPEAQTEAYSVKAQADHGEVQGEYLVPTIEKVFGDCRVWLEEDGLHARMYFANDDRLADHAWAISDNASYSIGIDWFPEGYYGVNYEIDEPLGILREISMVVTGNDPRAKTIDHKPTEAEAQGSADVESGNNQEGDSTMSKKTLDELTPDEREAMQREMAEVINRFTADVPESETEPTADEAPEAEEATTEEAPAAEEATEAEEEKQAEVEEKKDGIMPVLVIKDRVKQENFMSNTTDYLKTDAAVAAWGKAIADSQGDKAKFADSFKKIAKADGVDLGENVSLVPEAVINAVSEQIEDEDRIFSHVFHTGLNFEVAATATSEEGATGHVRGKTKKEEAVELAKRVLVPADLYKLMKLDHSMVKINGGVSSSAIVRYILREMPRRLFDTIDQAILVGGVASDSLESGETEFTALLPIIADIAAKNTYGDEYTPVAGDNAKAIISKAASRVVSGYDRTLITTEDKLTDLENALVGQFPAFPNGIDKNDPRINGIRRIITPRWLTSAMLGDYENGIIVDLPSYHTVGDDSAERMTGYDLDTNKYIWELVACIGGGLVNKGSAIGIKAQA
ncbi:MAG: hypothetical protein U0L52_01795 [Bacteroidaceae bacterium]|nr:hypothetical protein [Bacteroidaceae bacterium]